ncbi:hypothetical protein [Peribacillus muralis]|uniref:hypothetical protein n=1 Tax=Peribacillus muralis TaxID=264697 RepID=UPI003D089F77
MVNLIQALENVLFKTFSTGQSIKSVSVSERNVVMLTLADGEPYKVSLFDRAGFLLAKVPNLLREKVSGSNISPLTHQLDNLFSWSTQ